MKPRQSSVRFTDEDLEIWALVIGRFAITAQSLHGGFLYASRTADRRDADLVLALRESRQLCDKEGVTHCIIAGRETALQGWDDEQQSLVELGLAMRIPKLPRRYR